MGSDQESGLESTQVVLSVTGSRKKDITPDYSVVVREVGEEEPPSYADTIENEHYISDFKCNMKNIPPSILETSGKVMQKETDLDSPESDKILGFCRLPVP